MSFCNGRTDGLEQLDPIARLPTHDFEGHDRLEVHEDAVAQRVVNAAVRPGDKVRTCQSDRLSLALGMYRILPRNAADRG